MEPIAAPANTLIVCWNEEAERNELVLRDALVTPSSTSENLAGCLPSASRRFVDLAQLEAVDRVTGQELGIAWAGDLDLAQHLADDHFEVLIVDVLAL